MIKAGTAFLFMSAALLASCGQSDSEETDTTQGAASSAAVQLEEKQPLSDVKSVTDQKGEGETQFNRLLQEQKAVSLFSFLHRDREQIKQKAGMPQEKGSFEGAPFMRYDSGTFFFPGGSEQAEVFAVQNPEITAGRVTKQAGSPDEAYENKMEGLWTEEYKYKDGTILIEKQAENAEEISTLWFESS
ncbi:hypothetical protein [Salibacterium qingdaonense]|uniref:Lipoprotein n=1 Tax=Salibacterium qingdaonense TaxID=266892 RepID=A0A1I4IR00_9BACI|nr:hypothetical protein [Salibacterium qingdaonense]SFL56799.1 hypothetical protein SAMN04488054_102187 [Salibacterium qingdaonense]